MATRGRPPKPEASRKSEPVSIRLTSELRARLEAERTIADPPRTLSQEIEQRIRESFDFDKSIQKLLGGNDYHYWLLRIIAQQMVLLEYHTGRQFVKDRYTFNQVKLTINTILDCLKPAGRPAAPESLTKSGLSKAAVNEYGKGLALLALAPIELAPTQRQTMLVLPEFVDPIAASQHLSQLLNRSVINELNEIWRREQKPQTVSTAAAKPRRNQT
jgi:hypothetical protein